MVTAPALLVVSDRTFGNKKEHRGSSPISKAQGRSKRQLLLPVHLKPDQDDSRVDGEVKVKDGRDDAEHERVVDRDGAVPTLALGGAPLRGRGVALDEVDDEHGDAQESIDDGHDPHESAVPFAGVEKTREQDDDGKLGDDKGRDARDKGDDDVVDGLDAHGRVERHDVPACAARGGDAYYGDVADAEALSYRRA